MHAVDKKQVLKLTIKIVLSFVALSALAMLIKPMAAKNYFELEKQVFDAAHYIGIAVNGYVEPATAAFFPLWPVLMKGLFAVVEPSTRVLAASLFSFFLFVLSIPVFYIVLSRYFDKKISTLVVSAYALNPNSLFHALPYAESIFALLSCLFLYCVQKCFKNGSRKNFVVLFLLTTAMGTARPTLLQLSASAAFALTMFVFLKKSDTLTRLNAFKVTVLTIAGSLLGYAFYGMHCLEVYGNFWAPFQAQSYWDRKFGFYWSILFLPKSVSGSDNVLNWDLQAFYFPFLLGAAGLFSKQLKSFAAEKEAAGQYLFWLCAAFAAAHSAVAFLTYPIFMSLARHVFAVPYIFFALAYVLHGVFAERTRTRILSVYVFYSAVFFVYWWFRYAREGWIG